MSDPVDLAISFAGIPLRNPLIVASGVAGYIREIRDILNPARLGAIVTKSVTLHPREGNPPWRIIGAGPGMLNAVGLANVGLERFLTEKLPDAADSACPVFVSIAGDCVTDYVAVAAAIDECSDIPAVELNVSCPNTDDGRAFSTDPDALRSLLSEVRPVLTNTKMIVKLSPDSCDIVKLAAAAIDESADGLTLINTMPAMAIDVETRQPRLSRGVGGLSGPPIHPVAVRIIHQVYDAVARDAKIPIIGLGGVMRWTDAAEFILAGATGVGLGAAMFVNPRIPVRIARSLERWTRRQGCASISELVGQVEH
jgi:dihydroorotate dehydrogenase (NAD+) catalytic subunit